MDIVIRMGERVVTRDSNGLFQTKELSFELTDRDIPADQVRDRTLSLRLQVKKLLVNTKVKEGLATVEQGLEELSRYKEQESGTK